MDFLSNMYKGIKMTVATVSGLAGVGGIIGGIVVGGTGGIILIVSGSLSIATAGFSVFDSIAAHSAIAKDIKKLKGNVDDFYKQNLKLQSNMDAIEKTKNEYIVQNNKLLNSLNMSEEQVNKLSDLKLKYDEINNKYETLIETDKKEVIKLENQNLIYINENNELRKTLDDMVDIHNEFKNENEKLKKLIDNSNKNILELEQTKNIYIFENEKLQKSNIDNGEQLEILKDQNIKLRELYNNSKELLKHLADAGDIFTQFSDTISTNVTDINSTTDKLDKTHDNYDETLYKMKILVEKLKDNTFIEFDKNNDGIITRKEFNDITNDMKND
jgi:hypothetical protein